MIKIRKKTSKICDKKRFIVVWVTLYLLLYLIHFVLPFARHLYFRFVENLTVDFAMGRAELRGANVTIGFFRKYL